jgi:hypothetical protein
MRFLLDSQKRGAGNWTAGGGPGGPGNSTQRRGPARTRQAQAGAHQADHRIVQIRQRPSNVQRDRQERLQARSARAARVQQPAPQRALQGACAGQSECHNAAGSAFGLIAAPTHPCRLAMQAAAGACMLALRSCALTCTHRAHTPPCACSAPASSGAAPPAVGAARAHRPRRAPWR